MKRLPYLTLPIVLLFFSVSTMVFAETSQQVGYYESVPSGSWYFDLGTASSGGTFTVTSQTSDSFSGSGTIYIGGSTGYTSFIKNTENITDAVAMTAHVTECYMSAGFNGTYRYWGIGSYHAGYTFSPSSGSYCNEVDVLAYDNNYPDVTQYTGTSQDYIYQYGGAIPVGFVNRYYKSGAVNQTVSISINNIRLWRYGILPATPTPEATATPTATPIIYVNPTITGTGDYTNTLPGPISPLPIGAAGDKCYLCNSPSGFTMYFVSHWIAWLGCVIRNMFACDLRVWLRDIANSTGAIATMGIVLFNWMNNTSFTVVSWLISFQAIAAGWVNYANNTVQVGVNWLQFNIQAVFTQLTTAYNNIANYLSLVPQQVMVTVNTAVTVTESGSDWLGTIWAVITVLFLVFLAILGVFITGMAGLLMLLIMMITAIITAFQAPPYEFHLFAGLGGDPMAEYAAIDVAAALAADGVNDSKMYTFLLWALHAADTAIAGLDLGWLMFLLMGMIGVGTAVILISQWKQILPN